jgi:hypothetical protein
MVQRSFSVARQGQAAAITQETGYADFKTQTVGMAEIDGRHTGGIQAHVDIEFAHA